MIYESSVLLSSRNIEEYLCELTGGELTIPLPANEGEALRMLRIMQRYGETTPSEVILERFVPCLLFLTRNNSASVRASAVRILNSSLDRVERVLPMTRMFSRNIFSDRVFPALSHLPRDDTLAVRVAYAKDIGNLAQNAMRLLEASVSKEVPEDSSFSEFDRDISILRQMLDHTVTEIFTDSDNVVRKALVTSSITKLSVFMGQRKTADVVLPHMLTMLDDEDDEELRGLFFTEIVGVAENLGSDVRPFLLPFLEQGLADPEDSVRRKAAKAMAALTES